MTVQLIQKDGQPEWAVVPYQQYRRMIEALEMIEDIQAFDEAKARVAAGEEVIPSEVTFAILDGASPIRVWREYRGLTQQQLADQAGISKPYLSQLESGKRTGTLEVLQAIAQALGLDLEDVLS
jgi:DNA-binding XRE family transcriptional regulator